MIYCDNHKIHHYLGLLILTCSNSKFTLARTWHCAIYIPGCCGIADFMHDKFIFRHTCCLVRFLNETQDFLWGGGRERIGLFPLPLSDTRLSTKIEKKKKKKPTHTQFYMKLTKFGLKNCVRKYDQKWTNFGLGGSFGFYGILFSRAPHPHLTSSLSNTKYKYMAQTRYFSHIFLIKFINVFHTWP